MKEPTYNEKERYLNIRKGSKTGVREPSRDDLKFCEYIYANFKEWVDSKEVRYEIYRDTVPFGGFIMSEEKFT